MKLQEQLIRNVTEIGNGAHVFVPRDWLDSEVTIILKKWPLNIKEDILKLLTPYFKNIIGIYIVGSYARGEATLMSDVDILIITNVPIKLPKLKNYHLITIPINLIKTILKDNPILVYPMIVEAKPILNEYLLNEIKQYKIDFSKFKWYIETSKSSLKLNKEFLNIEKIEGNKILKALSVIYSLTLRLRGAYMIEGILKNKPYSNKNLIKSATKEIGKDIFNEMYGIYRAIRDNKQIPKYKITLENVQKLYKLVNDVIKKLEKLI